VYHVIYVNILFYNTRGCVCVCTEAQGVHNNNVYKHRAETMCRRCACTYAPRSAYMCIIIIYSIIGC